MTDPYHFLAGFLLGAMCTLMFLVAGGWLG